MDELERLNSLIAESGYSDDDGEAKPAAQPKPEESKPETVTEDQHSEETAEKKTVAPAEGDGAGPGETVPDENGGQPTASKPTHTPEERKEYAWKSLRKQNQKLNQELEELRRQVSSITQKPEVEKEAAEFATDADYQKYLIDHRLEGLLSKKAEDEKKQYDERQQEQSRQDAVYQKIRESYSDPDEYKIYTEAMAAATAPDTDDHEGGHMYTLFNENPDSAKALSDFCANSPLGARIMFHFAMVPADCAAFAQLTDPVDRKVELRLLEKKLNVLLASGKLNMKKPAAPAASPAATATTANPSASKNHIPIMGKLGTGSGGNDNPSDDDIINDIRRLG